MMLDSTSNLLANSITANVQGMSVSVDFTLPPPPTRPIGSPIVQWNMDTVTPNDTTTDRFNLVWTSDSVPDSSNTPNPGLIAGNTVDPLLLGNAIGQFPVATRPTITSGSMGVSGEALSFDGVDDQAFGIIAWLADTSEPSFIPGLEGIYVSLDFNEVSNTDGTQVLASARGTWELRIDPDGNLEWFTALEAGGSDVIETPLDAPGDWHNVEAWLSADGVKALAIDGVVVAQSAPGILLEDRDSIVLGNRESESFFFEGLIDNVYVGSGVQAVVPGDYNGDGSVDAADYTVWRDNLGGSESAFAFGSRDMSISGPIGAGDYSFWRANFGNTSGNAALTPAVSVPEPGTLGLFGLACLAIFGYRRKHCM